jgi:DNA adenine methylase
VPIKKQSFVGYSVNGFNLDMHYKLFQEIKNLGTIKFVMSNSKVELVTKIFKEYKSEDIIARRAINSKKPGSTVTELIIYN